MPNTAVKSRARKATTSATKRCGLYVRVSTEMQTDRNSLSTQETHLRQYARHRKWVIAKVFTDAGLSAKNTKRPAFQQMLTWAKEGKLDVVLVDKLDRISRNLLNLLNLIDDLKLWGVDFVSASQSFDTSTPTGTLMLSILGSFAQFEREMTADRVRENMLERAKKGLWSGGATPLGYKANPDTKVLEIAPDEARTVREVFCEFLATKSVRKTCHNLNAAGRFNRSGNPWALVSIRRILTNPTYIGTLCYAKRRTRGDRLLNNGKDDWITVPNAHAAIIKKADFEKTQAILSASARPKPWGESSPHLLTGLGRCSVCGSRIVGTGGYYRCVGRIQKGLSYCKGLSYREGELDQAIVGQITGFDAKSLCQQIKEYQKQAAKQQKPLLKRQGQMQQAYEKYATKEMRLLELYEDDIIDITLFKERRGQLSKEKLAIAADLADIEARLPDEKLQKLNANTLARQFADLQKTFSNLDKEKQRRLLGSLVREFTAYPDGRVQLDLNLLAGLCGTEIPLGQYQDIELVRETEPRTLGERIRQYRTKQNQTQREFSKFLGVGVYTLCLWEQDRHSPSPRLAKLLREKTGIDPERWQLKEAS